MLIPNLFSTLQQLQSFLPPARVSPALLRIAGIRDLPAATGDRTGTANLKPIDKAATVGRFAVLPPMCG